MSEVFASYLKSDFGSWTAFMKSAMLIGPLSSTDQESAAIHLLNVAQSFFIAAFCNAFSFFIRMSAMPPLAAVDLAVIDLFAVVVCANAPAAVAASPITAIVVYRPNRFIPS